MDLHIFLPFRMKNLLQMLPIGIIHAAQKARVAGSGDMQRIDTGQDRKRLTRD